MEPKENIDLSKDLDNSDSDPNNAKQAQYIIYGFIILVVIVIISILVFSGGGQEAEIIMPPANY